MESTLNSAEITMFICANCARPAKEVASAGQNRRPSMPDFGLPGRVRQVVVPCTGRLQPEHVLRAFESGSDLVSVVACREDNCHYAEGSRRCTLRMEHIRSILSEIGLGEGRLLLSFLPGSASQDLDAAAGRAVNPPSPELMNDHLKTMRNRAVEALRAHPPNPLRELSSKAAPEDSKATNLARDGGVRR